MTTWLDVLTELTNANIAAIERAKTGEQSDWKEATRTAAAVNDLLRRYREAGSPGLDTRYTLEDATSRDPQGCRK